MPKKFIFIKMCKTQSAVNSAPSWKKTFSHSWNVIGVLSTQYHDSASLPTSRSSGTVRSYANFFKGIFIEIRLLIYLSIPISQKIGKKFRNKLDLNKKTNLY
ncbi:MAG: hypothetical protein ACFFDF_24825 [Candidatus Odinarchaeota archaeon]